MEPYTLKIVQLGGLFFEGNIEYCNIRTTDGCMTILPKHISIISSIEISGLKFKSEGKEHICAISGGFLYIEPTGVTIITEEIQNQSDINTTEVLERKKILENYLKEKLSANEQAKISSSLKQAINLLNIKQKGL